VVSFLNLGSLLFKQPRLLFRGPPLAGCVGLAHMWRRTVPGRSRTCQNGDPNWKGKVQYFVSIFPTSPTIPDLIDRGTDTPSPGLIQYTYLFINKVHSKSTSPTISVAIGCSFPASEDTGLSLSRVCESTSSYYYTWPHLYNFQSPPQSLRFGQYPMIGRTL